MRNVIFFFLILKQVFKPSFSPLNSSTSYLGEDIDDVETYSPFLPVRRMSRTSVRSLQTNTLKARSCSVVSTRSVDRNPGLSVPSNIIRSLSSSLNQTQRSFTSLVLGVEVCEKLFRDWR